MSKLISSISLITLFFLSALSACTSSTASNGSTTLTITPQLSGVVYNGSLQFSATGGTSPYTYTVTGGGSIDSTLGLYYAPDYATTATVTVTDSSSPIQTASTSVTVSSSGTSTSGLTSTTSSLTVNISGMTLTPGQVITLTTTGGSGYYTYSLVSGGGTLSGTQYTAPSTLNDTIEIAVTDTEYNTTTDVYAITTESGSTSTGSFVSATTNSTFSKAWSVLNLLDSSSTTCYSSAAYTSATPKVMPYVVLFLGDSTTSEEGLQTVTQVNLQARTSFYGFPVTYTIFNLDSSTNNWDTIGNYNVQPSFDGTARIVFNAVYTSEIAIVPTELGHDQYGNFLFQLCGVSQ